MCLQIEKGHFEELDNILARVCSKKDDDVRILLSRRIPFCFLFDLDDFIAR